ncbi:MAG: hypothetical protein ACE5HS_15055 [bacterium]
MSFPSLEFAFIQVVWSNRRLLPVQNTGHAVTYPGVVAARLAQSSESKQSPNGIQISLLTVGQ